MDESLKDQMTELKGHVNNVLNCNIDSKSRTLESNNIAGRIIFSYMAKKYLKASYENIGKFLCKNHATIIHYLKGIGGKASSYDTYCSININGFIKLHKEVDFRFRIGMLLLPKRELYYNIGVIGCAI